MELTGSAAIYFNCMEIDAMKGNSDWSCQSQTFLFFMVQSHMGFERNMYRALFPS